MGLMLYLDLMALKRQVRPRYCFIYSVHLSRSGFTKFHISILFSNGGDWMLFSVSITRVNNEIGNSNTIY